MALSILSIARILKRTGKELREKGERVMAIAKCTDCGKPLERIDYGRRLRPGEYPPVMPGPLCHSCWQADDRVVEASLRERVG